MEFSSPKLKKRFIFQEELPKPEKPKKVMNKFFQKLFYHKIHTCSLVRTSFIYTHFWKEYA